MALAPLTSHPSRNPLELRPIQPWTLQLTSGLLLGRKGLINGVIGSCLKEQWKSVGAQMVYALAYTLLGR